MVADATPRRGSIASEVVSRSAALARGASIGRYLVLDVIGEGGMGVVASAYDPELDRKVALKVVHATHGSEDAARLLREARALARFTHPNVVAVHDVGEHDDGVYVAMELIDGVTMREWIRERPPWREVVRVFLAAGRGLAAAHHAGLVHRDFKPANVVLGRDGRVRVLDFGLARTAISLAGPEVVGARPSTLDVAVTNAAIVGTPAYMAPEQHLGGRVDARADQWAFCVALHEALYGVRPFVGNDEAQVRAAILSGSMVATADGAVPPACKRLIERGLSEDPSRRFADMDALLAALVRLRRRRSPWRWIATAAVVLALVGVVAMLWWRRPEPDASAWIDARVADARAAAAKAYFVYPPVDAPEYETAYRVVLALEAESDDVAASAANALRAEFAATLERLGDRYWDEDGGRAFAVDYYVQALVFAPDDLRARERAVITPGELALLARRADRREFSAAELEAAEVLTILAEPDDERRRERLRNHRTGTRTRASQAAIDVLLDETPAPGVASTAPSPPRPSTSDSPRPSPATAPSAPARDTKQLAERAASALARGDGATAEQLYNQLLSQQPRSVAALAALSDIHFDRGAYSKAVDYASRAVAIAPRRADLRIRLGDALFKVLRYADARTQYEKAAALGHRGAAARIAQVTAKLGG